jgi:predicted GIY-YIG superfamily endonuclease
VYVLRSLADSNRYYTGTTSDLNARLAAHNAGRCPHMLTAGRGRSILPSTSQTKYAHSDSRDI